MNDTEEKEEQEEFFEHHRIVVDKGQSLLRIDKFLMDRLMNASRNKIQTAAKSGAVLVNGKAVKSNYKVKPLDLITIVFPDPPRDKEVYPEKMDIDVVYEDDDELDSEYIGPLYGLIDEDVVGPGDDYLPWWDDVDKQFGWKFGYKVPFEWFYKIPYFEFPKWPFFEKSVYWLRYFPKELLPVQRFRYHRNYFGYGEDWEIGGLSIRDRIVALELQNSIVARTWTECFNDTLLVTKDVYYTYSFFAHEKYNLRSPTEVIIGPPNIDIRDYNRVITEKMHNKPSCYDY